MLSATLKFIAVFGQVLMVLAFATGAATAQENKPPQLAGPIITGSVTNDRVRIAAPNAVVQLRLEVYDDAGQKVLDTEQRGGNVLDWHLQGGSGERVTDGAYLCVVTVKSLSGRLSQRLGLATIDAQSATLRSAAVAELSLPQAQAVGPIEGEDERLAVITAKNAEPVTVLANTGDEAQLVRTRGPLTFRLGDFFAGTNKEQMRLTEDGNLGIGTTKPRARLDVAGAIRAREGFQFSNGSTLNVNDKGTLSLTDNTGNPVPNVGGIGTQGRLAKWTDNAGTLGDSVAVDTGTGLQMTAAPSAVVDTNLIYMNSTNGTTGMLAGSTPAYGAANGPFFAMRGNTYTTFAGQRGIFTIAAGNITSPTGLDGSVKFNTGNDQVRMIITPTGNVGVGTTTPSSRFDVAGDINTSTQYNIGGNRILSAPGSTSNLFAGVGAGQNNTGGVNNSFFGQNAGLTNTTGNNNAFFGQQAGQLSTGSNNAFFGDRAGFHTSTGGANAFFGQGAGQDNSMGGSNSFFGGGAGASNTMGSGNSFVGAISGFSNTVEDNNTFIGYFSNGATGINNATAIGFEAQVTQSNSIVLGSINTVNGAAADTNIGIGTTTPARRFHVKGVGSDGAGQTDVRITGTGQTAAGITLESTGTGGRTYSWLSTADNLAGGGFGPGRLAVFDVTAGSYRMVIDGAGNMGIGTFSPDRTLTVNGTADKPGGGSWDSFSDERLKNIKGRFTPGLKAVMQLQPLRYAYKRDNALGINSSGEHIGFGAQAVQRIIPEAVSKNDKGYLLVNNDPILWTMLNAIKEQQQTIEHLQMENARLKTSTEARLARVETNMRQFEQNRRQSHQRRRHSS